MLFLSVNRYAVMVLVHLSQHYKQMKTIAVEEVAVVVGVEEVQVLLPVVVHPNHHRKRKKMGMMAKWKNKRWNTTRKKTGTLVE